MTAPQRTVTTLTPTDWGRMSWHQRQRAARNALIIRPGQHITHPIPDDYPGKAGDQLTPAQRASLTCIIEMLNDALNEDRTSRQAERLVASRSKRGAA